MSEDECDTPSPWFDPRKYGAGALVAVAALGGGSYMGYTIAPEDVTELRITCRVLDAHATHLEEQATTLSDRVEVLEDLVDECRGAVAASRRMIGGVP